MFRAFIIACFTFTLCSSAARAETFRLVTAGAPTDARQAFVDVFVQASGAGGIRFEVKDYGFELNDAIELARTEPGVIALVPLSSMITDDNVFGNLLQTPGIFRNFDEHISAQQSIIGDLARDEINDSNILALDLWNSGQNSIFVAQRPIRTPSDLEGLKFRTDLSAELAAGFGHVASQYGAVPVPLPWNEVYLALQTGLVEGAEMDATQFTTMLFAGSSEGTILNNYAYDLGVAIAQTEWWFSLSARDQNTIFDTFNQARDQNYAVVTAEHMDILDRARDSGFEYRDLSAEDSDEWASYAADAFISVHGEKGRTALEIKEELLRTFVPELQEDDEGNVDEIDEFTKFAFFATDRRLSNDIDLAYMFSAADGEDGIVHCGPLNYQFDSEDELGVYEGPLVLGSDTVSANDECIERIAAAAEESSGRVIFMIPGFANSFESSVRRGLSFLRDSAAPAPVVIWSWPSKGRLLSYKYDSESVVWSENNLKDFVGALIAEDKIVRLDLVAHSMGGRFLTRLMVDKVDIGQGALVYIAPDVPKSNFVQGMGRSSAFATLYATEMDYALLFSKAQNERDRAGLISNMILMPRLDTIDASEFDWRPFSIFSQKQYGKMGANHHHALEQQEAVDDLKALLHTLKPANERGLRSEEQDGLPYYVIPARGT